MPKESLPGRVLKFGGTSLAVPERISEAMRIAAVAHRENKIAVVVSAMGHTTDALQKAASSSAQGDKAYLVICEDIGKLHLKAARQLASKEDCKALTEFIESCMTELMELLHGVSLVGECSGRSLDGVLSFGERLSAALAAASLRQQGVMSETCDTRGLIVTDQNFGHASVIVETTYNNLRAHFESHDLLQVIPGFVGSTSGLETTTLGRGGSDLTAAHVGAALDVEAIEIWTDVDGVMSADPRMVPQAFSLHHLRYEELMELAHFGARVVYPPSVHPARSKNIPLVIKNTLNPDFEGTWIGANGPADSHTIRGIASLSNISLLRLEGDGMVGVPGIAMRLFSALARRQVNVILIGQASSEHSICFAVLPDSVPDACEEIELEFALERQAGLIDELVVEQNLTVIAVVGNRMREHPGIAGQLFSCLGDQRINIRAIAQGSSELNISLVISQSEESAAVNAIHQTFFSSGGTRSHLFLLGAGRVGSAFVKQIQAGAPGIKRSRNAELVLSGITNSRTMMLDREGVSLDSWNASVEGDASDALATDLKKWFDYIIETPGHRVMIDCTAMDGLASEYHRLTGAGVDIVSANKKPFAGSYANFDSLMIGASKGHVYFETTVGAALPVLHTLQRLVETGDRIVRVEGMLSGTIGYLMHRLRSGHRFSESLREALGRGYTEPDPREDLTGNDVARKILILARTMGLRLEPGDVTVETLVPEDLLLPGPLDQFWNRLKSVDAGFLSRLSQATSRSRVPSYMASLVDGRASVSLQEVPMDHPCASLTGTESLVAFYTERYQESPLVVRGQGAGPELTASGVFADLLRAIAEQN